MSKEDAETDDPSKTQAENWKGAIPIHLTLAPTSVSSPTLPQPVHVLVPRNSYLHVSLLSAIQRLHPFAPVSIFSGTVLQISEPDPGGSDEEQVEMEQQSTNEIKQSLASDNETTSINETIIKAFVYPVCWLEDQETGMAVRWHLFAGVLFDLRPCNTRLPWRLMLHFTNYPMSQIIPLETGQVLEAIHSNYRHSLKQALTVMTGNSKAAMNVTKEFRKWESSSEENTL
jgi:Autophagy protein Apg5